MTKAGRGFLVMWSVLSLLAPGAALGQTRRSLTQEHGAPVVAPAPVDQLAGPARRVAPAPAEIADGEVIVPPAPQVVKRNPNAVGIPVAELMARSANQPAAPARPKYQEQPVNQTTPRIGSQFGYRRDPFTRRSRFHAGIDMKASYGDPIGASHAGVVQFAGWFSGYGNLVIVDHGGGVTTYYAHLSGYEVSVGDRVARGSVVGYAGSTGRSTSVHLHYEVRLDGAPVNPLQPIALDPSNAFFTAGQASPDAAAQPTSTTSGR